MNNQRIVLVTGSRDWQDKETIHNTLQSQEVKGCTMVLVHGDCWKGADKIANDWAKSKGWVIKRYPAKWKEGGRYNPGAGPERNTRMILDSKPHVALAFRLDNSRGTSDCIKKLKTHQNTPLSRLENIIVVDK